MGAGLRSRASISRDTPQPYAPGKYRRSPSPPRRLLTQPSRAIPGRSCGIDRSHRFQDGFVGSEKWFRAAKAWGGTKQKASRAKPFPLSAKLGKSRTDVPCSRNPTRKVDHVGTHQHGYAVGDRLSTPFVAQDLLGYMKGMSHDTLLLAISLLWLFAVSALTFVMLA